MKLDMALLDVNQSAEADRLTVSNGISSIELMENAGGAVAREIVQRWPRCNVTVLCGPGNNGGDGFVVARHLSELNWTVKVAMVGTIEKLPPAARSHAENWWGGLVTFGPHTLDGTELVVDALFGSGLNRTLEGLSVEMLANVKHRDLPVVAIDVPSGVVGDTGVSMGAVQATLTVTFTRKKPGHLLQPGRSLCGIVVVADIGTPPAVINEIAPKTFENGPQLWLDQFPALSAGGNKYTRGHALIVGGYPITGASRMAARSAARSGAGLTTIIVPELALPIYASALTSIMVKPMLTTDDFNRTLSDNRITGFLVGPGAGVGQETRSRVLAMLATKRSTVLDADALTSFQKDPAVLDRAIQGPCVMTPHDGEFSRLFDTNGDKLTRSRRAAKRSGAVIVLKGSDTVIASPDGRAFINANAPATLATAGSGDVLGGIILGLLTQGMDPFLAAAAGVWIHGECANEFGLGLIAEDLPDIIPTILRRLSGPPIKHDRRKPCTQ